MSLSIKALTSTSLPLVVTSKVFEVRRETDSETIYQLPDATRASKDLETIAIRKKTLAKNLNKHHAQQIVINRPWFQDVNGVSTLGGYENVTINISSSANATPLVRQQTASMVNSMFELATATGIPVASSDVDDFINARRL